MDQNVFLATIEATLMVEVGKIRRNPEEHRAWLLQTVEKACNAAMPKVKSRSPRKAYWWSEEIAELRRSSNHLRPQTESAEEEEACADRPRKIRSV